MLLQIPGTLALAGVLAALVLWEWIETWLAVLVLGAWVAKDAALYPWLRSAYESSAPAGLDALVGERGRAEERLAPRGFVRVRGELWTAEVDGSDEPIERGATVRVTGYDGNRLRVTALPDRAPPPSPARSTEVA